MIDNSNKIVQAFFILRITERVYITLVNLKNLLPSGAFDLKIHKFYVFATLHSDVLLFLNPARVLEESFIHIIHFELWISIWCWIAKKKWKLIKSLNVEEMFSKMLLLVTLAIIAIRRILWYTSHNDWEETGIYNSLYRWGKSCEERSDIVYITQNERTCLLHNPICFVTFLETHSE